MSKIERYGMTRKPSYKGTQAQPSFLLLGIMEHAGVGKPLYPPQSPLFRLGCDWLRGAAAKLNGLFK